MELDQSGKHMSLQSFKETLYDIDVPLTSFARGLGPSFGKLPRELRDPIYSDLIASGHPQFMSVSRVMNAEGMDLIYKKGVFKMGFDLDVSTQELVFREFTLPTANIVDKIQDLRVRIRSGRKFLPKDMQVYAKAFSRLRMFGDSPVTHGTCTIVFDLAPCCTSKLFQDIARSIEGLTNFDTVVMRMDSDSRATKSMPEDKRRAWIKSRADNCTRLLQAGFKTHLGQGDVELDIDGLRVIFHPRKAQQSNAVGEM